MAQIKLADLRQIAEEFNTSTTYSAGDYCVHQGMFYQFTKAHSGAWNAADVVQTDVGGELTDLKQDLNAIVTQQTIDVTRTASGTSRIDYTFYPGREYKYINNTSGSINLNVFTEDGQETTLKSSIPSGTEYVFTASEKYVRFTSYFAASGTATLESTDNGVFTDISDIKDSVTSLENDMSETITQVNAIKQSIGAEKIIDISEINFTSGSYVQGTNGNNSSNNYPDFCRSNYIDIDGYDHLKFTGIINSGSYASMGYGFYSEAKQTSFLSGGTFKYNQPSTNYETIYVEIPEGAKYFKTSWFSDTGAFSNLANNFACKLIIEGTTTDIDRIESELTDINATIEEITEIKPYTITTPAVFERIGVLGDSFSSGGIYSISGATSGAHYGISWVKILGRLLGNNCIPYAKPAVNTEDYLTAPNCLPTLLSDSPCNLYIIMLGINSESNLGTIADINDSDYTQNPNSFYGNMGKIYEQVKAHAPNAKFIFVKPPIGNARWAAIQEIAEHYNCPWIACMNDYFYNTDFYKNNKGEGHPVAVTYAGMALAFNRQISEAIVNNVSYFLDYTGND